MSINVALYHRTTYKYDKEITVHPQVVRLRPSPHCRTPILSYSLRIHPEEHFINWQQDPYGNYLARLVFPEKTDSFEIVVDLVADMTTINPFDFFVESSAENYPFEYVDRVKVDLAPYLEQSACSFALDLLVEDVTPKEELRTIDFLVQLNQKVQSMVAYQIRMEPGVQTCQETLDRGMGSCRDSAYLLAQLLRRFGIASRFVSGYLVQLAADEKSLDGPSGPEADFTDLHAWTEAYLPGAGWVGLDPTSGLFVGEGHIPLACTPEPTSAAPVTGAVEPCKTEFDFANEVTRVREDPRVTKPYSETEWASIDAVGHEVDSRLKQGDVRLTMGGEPTFVSIDDMEGAEWNTVADSPKKRELAIDLTYRLHDAFAPGGMIWFGEGKWYPGEPLPRWAYGIFWRKDGYPVWRDRSLLADPARVGTSTIQDAEQLTHKLAETLRIPDECVVPAFEDIEYYRWWAGTLPSFEKIEEAGAEDSLERRRLAELERRGIDLPVGFVIPMHVNDMTGKWTGALWKLRRDRLYLTPGTSALGLRLPLDSIRKATKRDHIKERSPMTKGLPPLDEDPLEPYDGYEQPDYFEDDGAWVPRTAITFEVREGRIHAFLPPTGKVEDYLQLVSAIEASAAESGHKVVIEGYEPPKDSRIESLKVTPDPGVIEVNIHPSASWAELVERTSRLYDEARLSRLGTEKFMIDGRHTGTGGGNHVVIGGQTPADSPFLRRPDLLASLVTYWQHHPGLSYLFSGLFIGPTSQAPRVDEARDDQLYELEIAVTALHRGINNPGMVDRIMRHLLTDLTGNTHRAEFCIDKMCSPDSSSGQLGLLELRAFEMPPHKNMALVQSLLVRALIAMFWDKPFKARPVRWGTALHDKFLLPHFVWEDVREVCEDLQAAGIPFQLEWLAPFQEFRFPRFGTVIHNGIQLEVRTALEPWHVLGEESSSMGTSRYVDSSLERLQVRLIGGNKSRHILICNGRRVPLIDTGVNQEFVGGVRFKAWNPPSSLHPMIEAQSELVFDIVDVRNKKSIGGCVYYVSHPGGRSFETFPVNAREAESRRIARFWEDGHTAGKIEVDTVVPVPNASGRFEPRPGGIDLTVVPQEWTNMEFPHTLDLRAPSSLQAFDYE